MGKPIGLFERTQQTQAPCDERDFSFFALGESVKAIKASYNLSVLIAEAGKPYSIDEKLVKPAATTTLHIDTFCFKAS